MANYQWRATTKYNSDTSLSYGVSPSDKSSWQTAVIGTGGSGTWTYWYRDTNVAGPGGYTDDNSSRVAVSITESWSTSVDDLNRLTVTITTTVNSIVRDDLRGTNQNTPCRDIDLYRQEGGTAILSEQDCSLASAHTIYQGPLVLGSYSFTIAPGGNIERSSLYLHNQTTGYSSFDDIWVGVQFRNILPSPTTYRVTYNANGGTGAPAAQSQTTAQTSWTFTIPGGAPTWGQYEFLGWSRTKYTDSRTEADVEYRPGENITLTSSAPQVTLYAVWRMDYRMGAILSTDGKWYSHNRVGGTSHILNGTKWQECRTIGAPTAMGNPPSVFQNGKWYNGTRIGLGGA